MEKIDKEMQQEKKQITYGGSSTSKLRALIKKNLLVLKRNIATTLCEILFPILLMVIMLVIRKAFTIKKYDYEEQEITTENFIKQKSVANVDLTNPDINIVDNLTYLWNGLSILPTLNICSIYNRLHTPRPLIGTIGISQSIKDKIIYDSLIYQELFNISVTNDTFRDFDSIEDLETYVKDPTFGTESKPAICFGMRLDEKNNSYNYSLHYFDSIFDEAVQDLDDIIEGPFDSFQSGPDMQSYEKYKYSGYTYIMKLINEYILKKETRNINASINFGMVPMKYVNYKKDRFGEFIGFIIPFFLVIAYMCPLCLYVYRMVSEKESRAKEGMKIMGLGEGTYFLSYFLQYLVITIFVSLVNTIIVQFIFTKIPFYFLYLVFFLWAMNVFALAFFYQSFIDSTRFALILSLLIYFIMYFLSIACIKETAGKSVKIGLSIFPAVAIEVGIVMLGKFESHFRKYKPKYFANIYTNYSLFYMFLMLFIDFFIYLFLGYYLQNVLPHEYGIRKPFYFIFTSEYWCGKKNNKNEKNIKQEQLDDTMNKKEGNIHNTTIQKLDDKSFNKYSEDNSTNSIFTDYYKGDPNFEGEALYKDKTKKDDALRIKNIKKTFGDGKTAVKNVNLNFYKDEIFALLGHNGAGKTTLISMLTGLYEATEGNAYYDGDDILIGNNMDKFRTKLGICPQHDVLFEDLTIKEHLEMFSIFKGVPSDNIDEEVNKSMNDFQLNEIKDIVIEDLSAGQKRQLSVAIALIGGSKVIFLDEPSSGMDITSRRNLWEILKRQLDQKIIILTTHYMEEASVLGNRIGIINEGRMKCIGTPLFLIEKFGKFMSINISKEEDANNEEIIDFINSKTVGTQIEVLSEEILFRIPKSNYSEGGNMDLGEFFTDLDNNLGKLKIKSYSVSMPTLEDVFLNVASEDSKQLEKERKNGLNEDLDNEDYDKILFETDFKEDYTKKSKFCNDFVASFKRRIFFILRDLKSFLMEVLCPILLVLIGLLVSKVKFKWTSDPWNIDISYIGKQNVLFSSIEGIDNITEYHFSDNYVNVTCDTLPIDSFTQEQKTEAIIDFIEKLYETNKDTEDSKLKNVDMTDENYVGYFGALLMLKEENDNYEFVEAINSRVAHGPPIYTFYFLKQIIQKAIGHQLNIDFTHYPMPLTDEFKQRSDQTNNSIVVLFVATAFSLIPSSFITILVRERLNNSKHLMRISGMNSTAYWIVNYIFELVKYYFTCGICVLLIWIFDYYKKYLTLLYILYGPAMISSTYILSFLFDKESTAQNLIILLNFLIGALCSVIILMLRGLDSAAHIVGKALEYVFAFMPSFCFNFGYDLLLNKILIYVIDYEFTWMFFGESEIIKRFNLLLSMIIYLFLEIIIYTILLFIVEYVFYTYKKPKEEILSTDIKDDLVLAEIEKANNSEIKISKDNSNIPSDYVVRLKNIRKEFIKSGCCNREKIVAIKNINFCVESGECFGLLGLNGAGKTSTFKCITQEFSPTNGNIYINGQDTYNNFEKFKTLIGYCPQYEAIFEYMTVYENLEFYARIKGIKHIYLDKLVNAMIKEMALDDYTKKIAGKLSGGNKRKLSVAVSLIGNPQIVLLDEPSTGMDPEARRFMWSIIHKTSKLGKKSSVIMTTHSMDEAETLCQRMGIMVNGEFVCLGKASEIKEKYGYGYEIDLRIKPPTIEQQNEYIQIINNNNNLLYNNNIENTNNILIYNKKSKISMDNLNDILIKLNKANYMDELKENRLGQKIMKDLELKGRIALITLLNWIFFVQNAFKFIQNAKDYFEEIYLSEHIENNFLFKMKKSPGTKSIGFFFGLFEKHKEECFVTEYSIQPTSLEQIFNQFAEAQISEQNTDKKKNNKNENKKIEKIKSEILINDELIQKILG